MVEKVLISMKKEFLQELDRVKDEERRTRSELIREAVRQYIRNKDNKNE